MRPFSNLEIQIADRLMSLGAIKHGAFRLKLHETQPNAPKSPIFLNLRDPSNPKPGTLTQDVYDLVAVAMIRLASVIGLRYDMICGIPRAGEPFAKAFAQLLTGKEENIFQLDKEELPEGKRRVVAKTGQSADKKHILLFDDLISAADSKIEAINAIQEQGGIVTDVLVLVDRCQGGTDSLNKRGIRLHSVFTLPDLLAYYVDRGSLTSEQELQILNYLRTQLL